MTTATVTAAPPLETTRLLLRAHVRSDFDELAALWADPAVVRYISGRPSTGEEVWARLLRYVGHWAVLGYGYWTVREKESLRFVGEVGFADFHRDMTPSFEGAPEAGWVLSPWAHGKGFATEALLAMHAWGDAHLGAARTVCMIAPENLASLRVAEKCGYAATGRATYKGEASVLFARPRAQGDMSR